MTTMMRIAQALTQAPQAGATFGTPAATPAPAAPMTPAVSNPQPMAPQAVAGMYPGGNSYGGIPVQRQAPAMMDVGSWGGQPMKAYNPLGPTVDSGTTMGGVPVKVPAAMLAGGAMWNSPSKDQIQGGFYVNRANAQNNARSFYDQPWDRDHAQQAVGVANRQNNVQPGPFSKDSWRGQVARANGYQRY